MVWERTGWRCVSVRQRRGAQRLCPVSQDVAAFPAIPEDKGCQELSGCPGQMPSILLATETFLQTKPYTEQSDPAPWASPHPTDQFQQPRLQMEQRRPKRETVLLKQIIPHLPNRDDCPHDANEETEAHCGELEERTDLSKFRRSGNGKIGTSP